MLTHVTVAEMQYRLDAQLRERDLARAMSIRERLESVAAAAAAVARPAVSSRVPAAWARPIGAERRVACLAPAT